MASRELDQALAASRDRLYPSVRNSSWLVLRERREIFRRWMDRLPAGDLAVLDVGGRLQPYRELLGSRVRSYTAVDIRHSPLVDVIAQGELLPFAPDSFDLVLCTQVLEYFAEPGRAIAEIHRVLRPGGTLILSVPAAHIRDADSECWSFHPAGIRNLLADYSDVEVIAEGGSIIGLFRTFNTCLNLFARYAAVRAVLATTVIPLMNLAGLALEGLMGSSNDQFSVNFSARARKPG